MKNKLSVLCTLFLLLFSLFISQTLARPREDVATLRTIAGWTQEQQLERDAQEFLQRWFMDNVRYYNDYLKGMEIEKQGKVKLDSYNKIKAVLGTPGTTDEDDKYYIRFLQDTGDPGTLSPYITFHSNNISDNGQHDNTCNHEGWHAVLGQLSFQEIYHNSLSAAEADAPRYYNGNSQPERVEHIYIENSQALIRWLYLLKEQQFEQKIIEAGEEALKILQKKDPNLTEVNFNKLTPEEQKKLIQPLKDIYFSRPIIVARDLVYPFCPPIKAELLKYCGMTFLNPDEVDKFYLNGGLQTSNGKKIILPDIFLQKDNVYAKGQVILNIMQETPYSEIYPDVVQSYIVVRPMHTASLNDQNYDPQRVSYSPEKGILTFELEDQSNNTFIGLSGKSVDGIKLKTPVGLGKRISVDLNEMYKNELQNQRKNLLFQLTFYLKNPNELKQPQSYKVTMKFEDPDYTKKISQVTYQDIINTYTFEIDPAKFAVTITSTNQDKKYSFQAKSAKAYKQYNWVITDESGSELYNSTVASDKINYEFKNTGKYKIQVRPLSDKGKYVNIGTLTIDIQNNINEIEQAYKAKDWKKLFDLLQKANKDTDIKLIKKYLKLIADEKYRTIKQYLDKMLAYQKAENDTYDKYKLAAAAEAKKFRENKDSTAASKIEQCMNDSYNKYEKQKGLIESDIDHLKYVSDQYTTYQEDNPQDYFFKSCDEIKLALDFDPSQPLKTTDYKTYCSNKDAVKADQKTQVIIKAVKINPEVGEAVSVMVKLQRPPHSIMCPEEEEYTWDGNHAGDGSQVDFMASKAGSHKLTVTVSCMGQVIGSDSVTFNVGGGGIEAKITGLQEKQVYFGSSKEIELDSAALKSALGSLNNVVVQWHSTPNLEFESPDESATKVHFNEIGKVKIFAKILKKENDSLTTIGESDLVEVNVISPEFHIEFNPAQDQAQIGKPITARIISEPYIPEKYIDYRWVEPADRKEIAKDQIEFVPKSNNLIKFNAIARVPISGETLNDSIKADYTPGEYVITVKVIGPKYDKDSQEWSEKDKGLVTKKPELVTDQHIEVGATVEKYTGSTTYDWSSNDGCSILGTTIGSTNTVSRHEPGICILTAIAYDKDKNKLGTGTISFDIKQQDSSTGKSGTDTTSKDNKKEKQQQAQQAIKKAEELASQGKFEEAEQMAAKAKTLDPENQDIKNIAETIKNQKEAYTKKIEKIETAIKEGKFDEAEETIKELEKDMPQNTVKDQLKDKLNTAKKAFVVKTLTNSKANIKKGDLETAIKDMEEAIKYDSDNTELKDLLDKTKKDKQQISSLKKQFDESISKGDYATADKILKDMKNISHYDPEVQEATKTLSDKSFNKRNELNNKLENVRNLISKGEIDQAITEAETIISESQKVNNAESIIATTTNLLNDLKNKKKNCEANIAEAERLISEGYYENAKNILNNLKTALPNYKPVLDLETKLNNIFNQQSTTKNEQKELSDKAFAKMQQCDYNTAVELIDQAKELNPDNAEIAKNAYDINNKNKIFLQDLDRAKLYLNRGDIDFAKEELAKHSSCCADNPDYIAVQELINDYYKGKDDTLKAKVAEVKALVDAKEYTKASNLAKEINSTLSPTGQLQTELNELHSYAIKKLSEKKGAINYFEISQTHYNQYNYDGCLKQLNVLEGQYPDCWEPSDDWPQRISQLRADALAKYNRVNELVPLVKKAASEDGWNTSQLQEAYKQSEELVSLNPKNYDYGAYKEAIKKKLAMAGNQKVNLAYAELQKAEDLYNQNKMRESLNAFESTFNIYNSVLDKNDSRYIHYKDVYNKLLSAKQQYEDVIKKYNDVFGLFEGEFDINNLNRALVQKMQNAVRDMMIILPNKQLAAEEFGNKLNNAANEFNQQIDKQIELCKEIAATGATNQIKEICTLANKMDPANQDVIAILNAANKPPVYIPVKDTKIADNSNAAGCGFTDTARFTISQPSFVNQIDVWFNWQQGQTALPYTMYFPNGQQKIGTLYRRACDTYQKSWCHASDNPNMVLQPGNYSVRVNPGRICQNSGTGGNGTIRVYSGPAKQNTGPIVSNPTTNIPYSSTTTPSKSNISMVEAYLNSKNNQNPPNTTIKGPSKQPAQVSQSVNTAPPSRPSSCNWSGPWNTNWGDLNLQQSGINITGNYTQDGGKIKGIIKGNQLIASWSEAPSYKPTKDAGDVIFTISSDCNSFSGKWRYGYSAHNNAWGQALWNGTRRGSTKSITSTAPTAPTTTTKSPPKVVCVVFSNKSSMPVHFMGMGEQCSQYNKVMPGQVKKYNVKMAIQLTKYYVGRNGQRIGTVDIPLATLTKGQTINLIYDNNGRFYWAK